MKILSDSYYEIGNSHVVCQDYARSGKFDIAVKEYHYAIVSDGCSSSKDTDVGSRLISLSVLKSLRATYHEELIRDSQDSYITKSFYQRFKNRMEYEIKQQQYSIMGLREMFDATLLVVVSDGVTVDVLIYGDGLFSVNYKDKSRDIYSIEYESNAPYYLSYKALSEERNDNYIKEFGKYNKILRFGDKDYVLGFNEETSFTFEVSKIESISIMSDGVHTFTKDRNRINIDTVVNEFTNFKNITGEFVNRRMLAYKRDCIKNNVKHEDDISIATLYFDWS